LDKDPVTDQEQVITEITDQKEDTEGPTIPVQTKIKSKKPKLPKSDAVITVCNPVTKEETFGKYTAYTIKGTDKNGPFEVIRRYSDFDKIRHVLGKRWPGVYIPPIPSKKIVKNLDSGFVEDRLKGLEFFCKNVSRIIFLHYSEEFQLFIRSASPDIEKQLNNIPKLKPIELIEKYSTTFSYLADKEINSKTVPKIFVFRMMYLTKLREKLSSFKKTSKKIAKAKKEYYTQLGLFHEQVCVPYEKVVVCELNGKEDKFIFTKESDPDLPTTIQKVMEGSNRRSFETVYEYIRTKVREVDSLIEAIDQRDKYSSMKNKAQNKQKSETDDLQRVQAGKLTLSTLFSQKPKDQEISKITRNISVAAKEAEDLNTLHDMVTLILAYYTIPKFIKSNLGAFGRIMEHARSNELLNLGNIAQYWEVVLDNENLKQISLEK